MPDESVQTSYFCFSFLGGAKAFIKKKLEHMHAPCYYCNGKNVSAASLLFIYFIYYFLLATLFFKE